MPVFRLTTLVLALTLVPAFGLPGFVPSLKELHPEMRVNCTSCHSTRTGTAPSALNLNDKARSLYAELLAADEVMRRPALRNAPDPKADFMVFGDTRDNPPVHREIVRQLCAAQPTLVLHTGDIVSDGNSVAQWREALNIERCLVDGHLLKPSCGNHEGDRCLNNELRTALGNFEKYYTVDLGKYTFIALDSNAPTAAQLDWLRALPPGREYIPFFHHPGYPTLNGHGASDYVVRNFAPAFRKLGVKLVFNGHNHGYDRALVDGVQWVTSGGGGAPRYPCGSQTYTQACSSEHHYLRCAALPDRIECVAKKPEGANLDVFTVSYP